MKKLNMKVTPVAMLLSTINTQNNISLTEADVKIKAPQVIADAVEEDAVLDGQPVKVTRNTSVEVDVLSDEVKDDFVTFKYQRISLTNLFSQVEPMIREVDVKKDGAVTVADVIAEILRKYSVLTSDLDFEYTITQNLITLIAKDTNLAFIDRVSFTVEQSLFTRINLVDLDGFEIPRELPPEVTFQELATTLGSRDARGNFRLGDELLATGNSSKIEFINPKTGALVSTATGPFPLGTGRAVSTSVASDGNTTYIITTNVTDTNMYEFTVSSVDLSAAAASVTKLHTYTTTYEMRNTSVNVGLLRYGLVEGMVTVPVQNADTSIVLVKLNPTDGTVTHDVKSIVDNVPLASELYVDNTDQLTYIASYKYGNLDMTTGTATAATATWPSSDASTSEAADYSMAKNGSMIYHASFNTNDGSYAKWKFALMSIDTLTGDAVAKDIQALLAKHGITDLTRDNNMRTTADANGVSVSIYTTATSKCELLTIPYAEFDKLPDIA